MKKKSTKSTVKKDRFIISLPIQLSNELIEYCNNYGVNRNSALSMMIKKFLEDNKIKEKMTDPEYVAQMIKSLYPDATIEDLANISAKFNA